jgi:hypothetical protein
MQLSGAQAQDLHDAILSGFDVSALERLVRFDLNVYLDWITPERPLDAVALALIKWAEQHGRTEELIRAIQRARPTNKQVQSVAASLLAPDQAKNDPLTQPSEPISSALSKPNSPPLYGPVPLDNPFYIKRAVDDEVLEVARLSGQTLVIKAPRQMGKSSLLIRYLSECRKAQKIVIQTDFSRFSETDLTHYPSFLSLLGAQLLRCIVSGELNAPVMENQLDMTHFLENEVLNRVSENLVLAFNQADRILGKSYQSDFFSMLRSWCDSRASSNQFRRLDLALLISTEPFLLIRDAYRSVFDTQYSYELSPFSRDECQKLNHRYSDLLTDDQVDQLWDLLNGHPLLTQLAYFRLTRPRPIDFDTLIRTAAQDDGPFGGHLRALYSEIKRNPDIDLLGALRQVIRGKPVIGDEIFYRLKRAGLVRRESDGRIVPANGLYARFFKDKQ